VSNTNPVEKGLPVTLPSGTKWLVLTTGEQKFVQRLTKAYTDTFKFTNISDVSGLDQIVQLEMLMHRIASQLALGHDYLGGVLPDEGGMRRQLQQLSAELRQLKDSLRLDRTSRTQDEDTETIGYITMLLKRADVFGIKRDDETAMAIELMNEVLGKVQLYHNSTEEERKEMRCTPVDIVEWLHTKGREKFDAIDRHFREVNKFTWFPIPGEGL